MGNSTETLIILTSGGLDSYIARSFARSSGFKRIRSLWIDIGQPYREKELRAIEHFPYPVEIIELPIVTSKNNNIPTINQQIIPGRNLLFAIIAASVGGDRIWLGALDTETHAFARERDKSPEFFHLTTGLLSYVFKVRSPQVVIESPFMEMSKTELVHWALKHGMTQGELQATSTCYHPDHHNCGECGACFKRWIAFTLNEIDDTWKRDPWVCDYALETVKRMLLDVNVGDYSHYSRKRVKETFEAIRRVRPLEQIEWAIYSLAQERDNV